MFGFGAKKVTKKVFVQEWLSFYAAVDHYLRENLVDIESDSDAILDQWEVFAFVNFLFLTAYQNSEHSEYEKSKALDTLIKTQQEIILGKLLSDAQLDQNSTKIPSNIATEHQYINDLLVGRGQDYRRIWEETGMGLLDSSKHQTKIGAFLLTTLNALTIDELNFTIEDITSNDSVLIFDEIILNKIKWLIDFL